MQNTTLKTAYEHFWELGPEDGLLAAMYAYDRGVPNAPVFITASDALVLSFLWVDTDEGYGYWNNRYEKLLRKGK